MDALTIYVIKDSVWTGSWEGRLLKDKDGRVMVFTDRAEAQKVLSKFEKDPSTYSKYIQPLRAVEVS